MANNYNEIICTAIDTIVSSRLEDLKYDITKICRIEDDIDKDQGKYIVSEGQVFFTAYSQDKTLSKGTTVQVIIPNGDFNMQKTIIGRVSSDEIPYTYISPLESMVIFPEATYQNSSVSSICANGGSRNENNEYSPRMVLIHSINNINGINLTGFTRLGVSADFSTLLKDKKVNSGTFGIAIFIYCKNKTIPYRLDLSSLDMFGNIYSSGLYSSQEKIFDISNINESITDIKFYLFENGNFKNNEDKLISYTVQTDNIFVKNIKIFFGYDKSECQGESLKLYTKDVLKYKYDQQLERELSLRWIHEYEENNKKQFKILTTKDFSEGTFLINWYQQVDDLDSSLEDEYGGNNWLKLNSIDDKIGDNSENPFKQKVFLNKDNQFENFKAVGIWDNGISKTYFTSNILTFTNIVTQKDNKTTSSLADLQIICEDGYNGKYSFYNQNGNIKDQSKGLGYERTLKISYKDQDIFKYFINKNIDFIEWLIPKDSNQTMISIDDKYLSSPEVIVDKEKYEDYYSILKYYKPNPSDTRENKQIYNQNFIRLNYYIKNFWQNTFSQNTIKCILSVNGVTYETYKDFSFNKINNNGTNYNFVIEYKDKSMNAINIDSSESAIIEAILYDNNEQKIGLGKQDEITWSWYKQSSPIVIDGSLQHYLTLEETNKKTEIKINNNEKFRGKVLEENYYILQATVNINTATQNNIILTAYLPIAIKKGIYSSFSGAKEILYNTLGTPEYDTGPYILRDKNNNKVATTLKLVNSEINFENEAQLKDYYPSLKQYKGRDYALSASPFYFKDIKNEVCVVASTLSEIAWSQPILIIQSLSGFSALNSWDGTLTMNEENGIIISSMIGAGRKNENGNFTGVLLGDLQTTNDMAEPILNTGVYGFNNNTIVYSLKDDGTATFGAKGKGQIKIDGNQGLITSGNWSDIPGEEQGMQIDLDDGFLEIKNKGQDRIYLGTNLNLNNSYFTVKSKNDNVLINISENDYYLQSDGYDSNIFNPIGTKINLSKGDIKVSSEQGFVNIQPQSPFIQIGTNSKILLQMGERNGYFIQSADFQNEASSLNDKQIYQVPINMFNVIGEDKVNYIYESDGIYYNAENNQPLSIDLSITNEEQETLKRIHNISENDGTLFYDILENAKKQKEETFKNSLIPASMGPGKGMRINLEDGSIIGYNIYFKAMKSSSDGKNRSLIINTSAGENEYPLMIGSHFKVDWEGRLWCDNITIGAGSSPQSLNYAININNKFVVDSSGNGFWAGQQFLDNSNQNFISTFVLDHDSNSIEEELDSKILIYKNGNVQYGFTLQNLIDYIKNEIQREGI